MSPGISREDVRDLHFIDAEELASPATTVIFTGATVVSTTSSTKRVVLSGIDIIYDTEYQLEADDIVVLSGTSGGSGDGTFTVAAVVDATTFDVNESIGDSTGGSCEARHPAGAAKVGADPTNLVFSSATDVQQVLEDLDYGLNVGHRSLMHLIHFLLSGMGDGYGSGPYVSEILPAGDPFPTSETWYKTASKTNKVVRYEVTYNANKTHATEKVILYKSDGVSKLIEATDTISYSGMFPTGYTRSITEY